MNPFLPIRIISRKIGRNYNLINYINALNDELIIYEGFIKTDKYWEMNTKHTHSLFVITDWESKIARDRWFHSHERLNIFDKYKKDIQSEDFEFLVKKKDNNDMFLL